MKHLTFRYDDNKNYNKAKKIARKNIYKAGLIQLFTSYTKEKDIQQILNQLAKDFPNIIITGTTTAGEISNAKMYNNKSIISLSLFKNSKIKVYRTKDIDKKSGKKLSKKLCFNNTKAMIILSEGLKGLDYEGFIQGIKKENPHVIIAGGLAGDNFKFKNTSVFIGTKIYKEGAIGISFSGDKLFADNNYNLNWHPIGKRFTITSAQKNILKEIDSQNAVEIFKKYLGSEIMKDNYASLPNFQLLYREGNTIVSRTPMTVNSDNHIVLAGPIKNGQIVQFGFSNASSILSASNKISKNISQNPAEAIYIYSCIARKTLLGKTLESEFRPFEQIAPTSGFFTYGEFYSTDDNHALLNCTTTILILSESKKSKKNIHDKGKNQNQNLDSVTFNILKHFIKQTSSELEENTQLLQEYKAVVDKSSLVSKTDIDGNITYVNDNFCRVSQYSRDELLGRNHNIIRDSSVSKFIFKKLWTTILKGKVWKGMLSNRAKDGTIYYVDATVMPIFNDKHQIKEFIAIRQDITKQVESKKRIKEKEKLIKAIFDNQDSIVIYSSKEKGMLNVNKKLFDTFEYKSFEEFKAKNSCICELFLKEDGYIYPEKFPNWLDDIASNRFESETKVKMLTKDKTAHTFNIMIKKINNEYIINLYDITKLENAMLKAYESERIKSIFLANMSHEIRTPLNGIIGFTDVLKKQDLDKDSKRYIDIIHKSSQTLLNVVNDILDFSKINSGELTLYETETNLFKEIEATVSTFSSVAKAKQVNYYVYIDTSIPKILLCDIQRIKQVLNNLISNAIKFTPHNGEVIVQIQLKSIINKKAKIHFNVKDNGIGIAKEKIQTIFQAFSQADNSISKKFGGTGLGLAISSQYVNMMNSKIEVKSNIEKGSEFYFDLELTVIDETASIKKYDKNVNISILNTKDEFGCSINDIIISYLDNWKYDYKKINTIDEIDEYTDVFIVCAEIFDQKSCENALNKYKKLHLIYIEGLNEYFSCSHEKFHLIKQPMTGSSLFDNLVNITSETETSNSYNKDIENTTKTPEYNGSILIAEDNETNQMLISIMLEDRKLKYHIVNNGQEAVDEALKNDYDIIFMDINMPILDGISATKRLREKAYIKPIVSLSANVIESDRESFIRAGVDNTLNKPIVPEELDDILKFYLNEKNKQKDIVFDVVNIDNISEELKIRNKDTIKKLLNIFSKSVQNILSKIEDDGLDANILHNLKGITGNLRFKNVYNLIVISEENISNWNKIEYNTNEKLIVLHLQKILKQIGEII